MLKAFVATTAAALALAALPVQAQNISAPAPAIPEGITVEEIKVHGPSLMGNLEGNEVDRQVMVVLPPSYKTSPNKRYPVVYYLHGFAIDGRNFYNYMKVPEAVAKNAAEGNEFIVVIPDTLTKMGGSMYSSSVTTGDFRKFIAEDLVGYIDSHYRTIATRGGRGLAGHSMGGYGTARIAMKRPEVFSSIYMMSACCLDPMQMTPEQARAIEAMTPEQVAAAQFGELAAVSTLATWSPDPSDDGFLKVYTGLKDDGTIDPLVNQRLAANSPVVLVPQYLPALNSLEAFAMDIGDKDFLLQGNAAFRAELDRFGVKYDFELYEGDHGNRIAERIRTEVLPFFGEHLDK